MNSKKMLIISCISGIFISFIFYMYSPARIATHFNTNGYPDTWSNKGKDFILWGFIYIFMTFLFISLPHLINKLPSRFVNIPHSEYWLDDKRRNETLNYVGKMLNWMGIGINLFFIIMGVISFHANKLENIRLDNQVVYVLLSAFFVYLIIWIIKFYSYFKIDKKM